MPHTEELYKIYSSLQTLWKYKKPQARPYVHERCKLTFELHFLVLATRKALNASELCSHVELLSSLS
jgi:hypothetical protein